MLFCNRMRSDGNILLGRFVRDFNRLTRGTDSEDAGLHLDMKILQLLQGDLAVVIGVDPLEKRFSQFPVQEVR
jgi:hypothetical protein